MSETAFTLILVAAAIQVIELREAPDARRGAIAGVLLGLAALTRTVGVIYLAVAPLWLAYALRKRTGFRWLPALVFAVSLLVVSPWELALRHKEGRWLPLSTSGPLNLVLGNHPWVPDGVGSSWGDPESAAPMKVAISEMRGSLGLSLRDAATVLARSEIQAHPGRFLLRTGYRLRELWAVDFIPLRHLLRCVYPPISPWLAGVICLLVAISYLALLGLVLSGLVGLRSKSSAMSLPICLVLSGMIPPALTVASSRMHLPLLVLLLPLAGQGAMHLREGFRRAEVVVAGALLAAVLIAVVSGVPRILSRHLEPSSHYAGLVSVLATPFGVEVRSADAIALRQRATAATAVVEIELATPGARLHSNSPRSTDSPDHTSLRWDTAVDRDLQLIIVLSPAAPPPELLIRVGERVGRVEPVVSAQWRVWRSTGIPGLEVRWLGGTGIPAAPPPRRTEEPSPSPAASTPRIDS